MLQDSLTAGKGCHLCDVRLQAPRCTKLPAVQSCIRQQQGKSIQLSGLLGRPGRSSRGRRKGVQIHCVQALERPTKESRDASRHHALSAGPTKREVPDSSIKTEDLVLPEYDRRSGGVELVVAGAGPSGLAVAERVSQAGIDRPELCSYPQQAVRMSLDNSSGQQCRVI